MKNIGMNARIRAIGAWNPTAVITKPRVATSEYTGAVEASPITVDPNRPSWPCASPFPADDLGSATWLDDIGLPPGWVPG